MSQNAWDLAEQQVAQHLAQLLNMRYKSRLVVGDASALEGRVNMAAFCLEGGDDQDQAWQAGALAFHTMGRLCAVFDDRTDARTRLFALLEQSKVPFYGGAGTTMSNVSKVYLRSHPTLKNQLRVVANGKRKANLLWSETVLGVVYEVV